MTIEELKALESQAPMPWTYDGAFSAIYGPGHMRLAEVEWIPMGPLAVVLRNLAPEILALVEAANHCRVEDCTGKTGFIDTDSDIHGWELCRALDAFNAKMEAL